MADEFDATRAARLPPAIILLATVILIGIALELATRWLYHRESVRRHRRIHALLYNLRWQPLLWSIVVGLELTMPRTWIARATAQLGINPLLWLALITVALFVVRALSGMATRYAEDHNVPSTSIVAGVIHVIGFLAIALIGAGLLGVPVDAILVALAGSSVGIGLALQQPLTNLFAGLLLNASDRFRPGELIRLNSGQEGRVVDVDWLTTTLEDGSANLVAVPNVAMTTAIVVNYDRPNPTMTIDVPIAVSRDSDLSQVERATLEVAEAVAREVEGVLADSPPSVSYAIGFDDYVLRFSVAFRVASHAHVGAVKSALVQRLEARYLAAGIAISYPIGTSGPARSVGPGPGSASRTNASAAVQP